MNVPSIRGYSGQYLEYLHPEKYTYTIIELGFALSKICRFAGHCHSHYSVAQHSVLVSHLVGDDKDTQMQALLHDAPEAFISDLPGPLKRMLDPGYKIIEETIHQAIMAQFGLPLMEHPLVKEADRFILSVERRDLLPKDVDEGEAKKFWPDWMEDNPHHPLIIPLPHIEAHALFTNRATELL